MSGVFRVGWDCGPQAKEGRISRCFALGLWFRVGWRADRVVFSMLFHVRFTSVMLGTLKVIVWKRQNTTSSAAPPATAWIDQKALFHVGLGFRVGFAGAQLWGPYDYTFYCLGIVSQLHRTSLTQGCLTGIILCNSGASIRYFLCTCQLHTLIVRELIFWLHAHTHTHICHTKESFPNHLCNHFGPHSKHQFSSSPCLGGWEASIHGVANPLF